VLDLGLVMPEVDGVRHRFVDIEGIRFHVAEAGEGEPLLMLHGWPQNWFMWRKLVPPLGRGYRLLMLDLRGFGWSDAPLSGYGIERLADDVLGVADALDIDRFGLMGHDWGGLIAYLVALREPCRVQRLMTLNIIHPWPPALALPANLPRSIYALRNAAGLSARQMRDDPAPFHQYIRGAMGMTEVIGETEMAIYLGPLERPERRHVTTLIYRTFFSRDVILMGLGRYRRRHLGVETLSLFGEDDRCMHAGLLRGYEGHARDMSVELVPDCGHFIVDEKPELVAARAQEFFRD
jgi:pimeloyl-ACP methyl ester carboxylesterase